MRTYAYVRVNPKTPIDLKNLIFFFNENGFKIQSNRLVVEEICMSKPMAFRNKLLNLIDYSLEEGDLLIVKSLDCLGNNFQEILVISNNIINKGIRLICLDYSKKEISGNLKMCFFHFLKLGCSLDQLLVVREKTQYIKNRKVGRPEILNDNQKIQVIEMYKKGESVYSLAKKFSVTRTVINRVIFIFLNNNNDIH